MLRILQNTPQKLVLRLEPIISWVLAAIFGGLGFFLLWLTTQRKPDPFLWYAALGSLAVGFGILWLLRFVTLTLDQSTQTLRIIRQGVLVSSPERMLALSEVAEVVLDESRTKYEPDDRPNPIYRVVFVLKSGERIPLTPYLDAERKSKARAIQLMREFMGRNIL